MPAGSDERVRAVRAWCEANHRRAYGAIVAAHPEAAAGRRCTGEITVARAGCRLDPEDFPGAA